MSELTADRCRFRLWVDGIRIRLYVLFLNRLYVDECLHRLGSPVWPPSAASMRRRRDGRHDGTLDDGLNPY